MDGERHEEQPDLHPNADHEVAEWAARLGVSIAELKESVVQLGISPDEFDRRGR